MKKFLLLATGVVFISGAVAFNSDAYYYSKSCFQQGLCKDFRTIDPKVYPKGRVVSRYEHPRRVFSNRVGPWKYKATKSNREGRGVFHPTRRQDVTFYRQYQSSPLPYRKRLELQRNRGNVYSRANARAENTQISDRHVVRARQYQQKTLSSYNPVVNIQNTRLTNSANYSLSTPNGFSKNNKGVYRKQGLSLAFQVKNAGSCSAGNAVACMSGLSTQFKRSQSIQQIGNARKDFRWNQIILNDRTYSPTITEKFTASVNGQSYVYFTYSAVNPKTNKVVRIEAVSSIADKTRAAEEIFKVFESLRLK